jgi:hypothetical protein
MTLMMASLNLLEITNPDPPLGFQRSKMRSPTLAFSKW